VNTIKKTYDYIEYRLWGDFMIKVNNLSKSYNAHQAVKNISFTINEASFFALLGPNGAGKSTTVNIISTLLNQTSGSVSIDGFDTQSDAFSVREKIGIVFQHSTLDEQLSVYENLMFRALLYMKDKSTIKKQITYLSELLSLDLILSKRVKTLSGGERRKVDVARALIFNPKYLILDEPTTGLDPSVRKQLWSFLKTVQLETKTTIILTTHYMEEVIDCDQVVIIDKGEIIAKDSAENLRKHYAKDTIKITPKDETSKALFLAFKESKWINDIVYIPIKNSFEGIDIVQKYKSSIETFEIIKGSMDDVFLHLTGRTINHEITR